MLPKNWAAKSARSAGRKFLVPLLLWNSIARKGRWGWLNCSLGGIFLLESMSWAKEYHIKLEKQKNNLGQIHHMYSHIYLLSEKGLVFYLYLQKFHMDFSLSTVIFAKANFDKRKFFLRHPVYFRILDTRCTMHKTNAKSFQRKLFLKMLIEKWKWLFLLKLQNCQGLLCFRNGP